MYRHSAALNVGAKTNGLLAVPTPTQEDGSASESDSETVAELDCKRRQLDEEIARFKAQKDKEFRDFELDLRQKRKRKRSPANGDNHIARTPPTDPSVLSLLGSRPQANGHAHKLNGNTSFRPKTPPPSKPTLSIDKLTIVGTTAPPPTTETPPAVLSRSLTGTLTLPRIQSEKSSSLPATIATQDEKHEPPATPVARDHTDPFAGVFTPSYLPLLDTRSSNTRSLPGVEVTPQQTEISQPREPGLLPPSGSTSSSLPSSPISPRLTSPQKRSYTSPLIPSASLPSALRAASGESSKKKRKHVTFRLADSAVVEPSSSYEELSSPDLPGEAATVNGNGKAKANGIDEVLSREEVPWSWSKGEISLTVEKSGMELAGDGDEDDVVSPASAPVTMIDVPLSPREAVSHSFNTFEEAEDGGSGVGFFELEEELNSPSPGISPHLRSPRSDRNRFFDDWGAMPDVEEGDDEDAEMAEQDQTGVQRELATEMEVDPDDPAESALGGLGISAAERREESSFASGSVPIDIVVRPSSSWIGSLGAGSAPRESEFVP